MVDCVAVSGHDGIAKADLVVIKDLSDLYSSAEVSVDDRWLRDRIYIFGLGKSVTTESSWEIAERNPKKLPRGSIVHHAPVARTTPWRITYTSEFKDECFRGVQHSHRCSLQVGGF